MSAIAAIIGKSGFPSLGKAVAADDLPDAINKAIGICKEVMGPGWDDEVREFLEENYEYTSIGLDGEFFTIAVGVVE